MRWLNGITNSMHMSLGLEFPRETGLILRCAGKAGNPFQTTQGNRLSCRDQEGPVFLPGDSPGWRSLVGRSPWGH